MSKPWWINDLDPQNERDCELSDEEIARRESSIKDQMVSAHEYEDFLHE
jgi:chromosome condensin MukBEF complex kleisin-like MukF subunit